MQVKRQAKNEGWEEVVALLRTEVVPMLAAVKVALSDRPATSQPEFLSVNEALRLLHVSRTQLYRLFRAGELTPVKRAVLRSFITTTSRPSSASSGRRPGNQLHPDDARGSSWPPLVPLLIQPLRMSAPQLAAR
jgi:hypothetical protein